MDQNEVQENEWPICEKVVLVHPFKPT